MLKKTSLLTRPTLARRDAPFPNKAAASEEARRTHQASLEPLASITCERISTLPPVGLDLVR